MYAIRSYYGNSSALERDRRNDVENDLMFSRNVIPSERILAISPEIGLKIFKSSLVKGFLSRLLAR